MFAEKVHDPSHPKDEKDMNDQVFAGTYRSQHFEVSPDAQRIYSDISKETNPDKVERSVKLHDMLFNIVKQVNSTGYSTKQQLDAAKDLATKIHHNVADFGVDIDHSHVNKFVDEIESKVKDTTAPVEADQVQDEMKTRTASPEDNYIHIEKQSDADIDNVKNFRVTRAKAAAKQRFLNVGIDESKHDPEAVSKLLDKAVEILKKKKK
jgi:hypothetical protein